MDWIQGLAYLSTPGLDFQVLTRSLFNNCHAKYQPNIKTWKLAADYKWEGIYSDGSNKGIQQTGKIRLSKQIRQPK